MLDDVYTQTEAEGWPCGMEGGILLVYENNKFNFIKSCTHLSPLVLVNESNYYYDIYFGAVSTNMSSATQP